MFTLKTSHILLQNKDQERIRQKKITSQCAYVQFKYHHSGLMFTVLTGSKQEPSFNVSAGLFSEVSGYLGFSVVGGLPVGPSHTSTTIRSSTGNSPSVRPVNSRPSVQGAVPHFDKHKMYLTIQCENTQLLKRISNLLHGLPLLLLHFTANQFRSTHLAAFFYVWSL